MQRKAGKDYAEAVVIVNSAGDIIDSFGGEVGGAAIPPAMAVIDSATPPERWVMVTDYAASPATVTFYEFGTTTVGTPTLPVSPDADADSATAANQLVEILRLEAIRDRLPAAPDSRGAGNVDATTQRVVLATDSQTVTAIGAQADAAAAADGTGNYGVIGALKRGLLNWATLLARIPALAGGRVPVEAAATATDAFGTGTREHNVATLTRQAVGAASARVALPALGASREVYVMASARCFFRTGDGTVTAAVGTSHPLATDERFYFRVPAGHTHIAYVRDSADGFITICAVA